MTPRVEVTPFRCPVCQGQPDGNCLYCHNSGVTGDTAGWKPADLVRLPRPPGVMKAPCGDCAFRCGSPEQERDYALDNLTDSGEPFWCHHGMPLVEGRYTPVATYDGKPFGYLACAGWWDHLTTGALPASPYRELPEPRPIARTAPHD